MKISPVNFLNYQKKAQSIKNNLTEKASLQTQNQISFKSIFADANDDNMSLYGFYINLDDDFRRLKSSSTRIFRELPSELAIAKLLRPEQKSEIKVLGCSDGSEAWAYAIAVKEAHGESASKNVEIVGVDIEEAMIEMAKTGRIVCSDVEKRYANNTRDAIGAKSPIKGDGWDKYLVKSTTPKEFYEQLPKNSQLKFLVNDVAVDKCIGNGLEWYEVNKEGLPQVSFKQGDMFNHLRPKEDVNNVVYVVANSAAYIFDQDPIQYTVLFEKIKQENMDNDADVYVVVGKVENTLVAPTLMSRKLGISQKDQQIAQKRIKDLGFEKVQEAKIRKLKIDDYKDASSKIYVLRKNK